MIGILIFCFVIHLILIPILLGVFLYREFVTALAKYLRPDLDSFVTGIDLSLLSNSPDKAVSNLLVSFVVKGNVSENRIQAMAQERVLTLKDSEGNLVYKKLSQFWTPFLGFAFWKTDKSFSLSNHVRKYDYEDVILPKPGDETSLKEVMAQLLTLPWRPNRSHWEVFLVSEYNWELGSDTRDQYSLVIVRVDHSILDAMSGIGILGVGFQSPFATPRARRNAKQISLWDKYKLVYLFPYALAKQLPVVLHGRFLNKLDPTSPYVYDASERIPVSTIKKIKDKHEVDYGSVIHSAINGGICQTVETLQKVPPKYIDMVATLPMPDHPGGTSNHLRTFLTELPLKSISSIDRLMVTNDIVRKCGANWSSMASINFIKLLGIFPLSITSRMFSSITKSGPSYSISIIPVTSSMEFIDNAEIVDVYANFAVSTSIGMNICVWGINNQQRVNFCYTPNLFGSEIPKGTLSKYMAQELKELATNLS
ncbi:unnamed protein product [Allacma fusca]|uniref:O-acyltransferase WSD1 C-terminal domain-containing protein n=1 Tax=Allacma fusca TaxID=39272 RepID=A0A8J2P3H9_9HEXA|nr:unnamed protein product [Allacma fusca]